MIALFKLFLGLKICRGLKPPKPPWCYGSGMWNVEEKDNNIEQTHCNVVIVTM